MKTKFLSLALAAVAGLSYGQTRNLWTNSARTANTEILGNKKSISNPTLFNLDVGGLKNALKNSPAKMSVAQKSSTIITFPSAKGKMEDFRVSESSNFDPALAAKYPDIKSYVGQSVENPSNLVYFSVSPLGLSSMEIDTDNSAVFIEPYTTDGSSYVVYQRSDKKDDLSKFECSTIADAKSQLGSDVTARPNADDGKLRTFRLALSCTGEYAAYFGGTKAKALAAMNNTMTRVNAVFERDFSVRMVMIASNDNVIYTNASSDPYSSSSGMSQWNGQLQSTLTSVIGEANYDVGHLFGASGGGGNAGCIGCVCVNNQKGSGITSPADGIPSGDNFDIDYVAHELGHQFGGNHTFTKSNEGTGVHMEPGSGSTIMGYAGITNIDVQPHSDPFFHAVTIQQITNNVKNKTCPTVTSTGNAIPTANAGSDYTIPKSTPFMLTGTSTDANGDALTYIWEQMDSQTTAAAPSATKTTGVQFRSWIPTTSPTRYFPTMSSILAGSTTTSSPEITTEALSSVARTLNFRYTVRDNRAGGSGNNSDDAVVTVTASAGPFAVTSQTSSATYAGGSSQTVTWNVAGTTSNGINAANVDILWSADGGKTWDTILAATPNDGSQSVTIPNKTTSTGRIMVKGSNHVFFNVNKANLSVTAVTGGDTVAPTAPNLSASGTTSSSTQLSWSGATDNIGVTGYDVYSGSTLVVSVTSTSTTITGLSAGTTYVFTVKAKDAAGNVSVASNAVSVKTTVAADTVAPTAPSLSASGTTATSTSLTWSGSTDNVGVTGYDVYSGSTLVVSVTSTSTTITGLSAGTNYVFTVKAKDAAGNISVASNMVSVTTTATGDTVAPTAPNLTASGTTDTSTDLSWSGATDNVGVTGYDVYSGSTLVASVTTTSTTITGLSAGTNYVFTVKAKDAAGNVSVASNTVNVQTTVTTGDTVAPTAPVLSVVETTATSARLSWNGATDNVGVTAYDVYSGTTLLGTVTDTTANVTGLTTGTTYVFTVKAKDAAGNVSAASNAVSVKASAGDTIAPTAPTLIATQTTATSTKLSWSGSTDNVGVTGYDVYLGTTLLGSVTGTSATVTGLSAGSTYVFTVKAKDAAGNVSVASNAVTVIASASVSDTTPPTSSSLSATGTTANATNLAWSTATDNVGVIGYEVYQNSSYLTSTTDNNYSVSGLKAGTSYTFYVKAKDAAGNLSAASNTVSVTTLSNTVNYCTSTANNTADERIGNVRFNTINNTSTGTRGYEDFTSISTNVSRGSSYALSITPVWRSTKYSEAYAVYIDFNGNGVFTDAGEKVYTQSGTTASSVSATVKIPTNAVYGPTRMRVMMKYYSAPTSPCETISYGQVEDYTINITATGKESVQTVETSTNEFAIYPNPVSGSQLNVFDTEETSFKIFDMTGKLMQSGEVIDHVVNVGNLSQGVYIIQVGKVSKRFIKK